MATIHKLTKDGATIFPATITDAVIHPQTGKTLTSMIKDYNVSELFPTEGIDGGNKYSLALAIQVLGTHLSAAQKTGGIRLTFISSVSPYPEEEYYLGKSSWSTVAADWDQRFEVGDVIADPSGSWEPGTAESYVDQKVATITGNLANETIARQTVDQSLQTQINAEATIRANVDNTKADKATTLAGYGITNAYTKTEVDDLVNTLVLITWSGLKALRDGGNLVAGQWYRITDYTCTTIQENTQSAGHAFDIIVRADSTNTLNENAYAAKHEGDTYFANSNLAAWKLKYTLDNIYWSPEPSTTCTFQTTGGSSHNNIAYIGTEERNGTTWYKWDFSQYGHEIYSNYFYTEQLAAGDAYANSMGQWRKVGTVSNVVTISVQGKGTITWMKDEFDNECPYDFKNIQFKVGAKSQAGTVDNVFYYTFSMASGTNDATVTDYSLNGSSRGNRIGKWISGSTQKLNFNVFRNTNTIFTYDNNTFGNNCYNNTFGSSCQNNTFGDSCSSNTFGSYINNNTFGDGCSSNTFSAYNNNNMFGNNCYNNTFGGNDTNNTFGNGCSSNSFYIVCSFNKFEDNCDNNMFGDGCTNNSFGNNCAYNTFGHDCHYNSFGNDCRSIKFLKDCMQYNIVENGNKYIDVTSTQTTSSANTLRNITIAQGVNNTSTVKTISHNTVNDTFKTTYQAPNSQIISV